MNFTNLHSGIKCDCISDKTSENTQSIFIHKISNDTLCGDDFLSYWEKGKRPPTDDCDIICKSKGISFDELEEGGRNESSIINRYKKTEQFKPSEKEKYGYYCKIKFKINAGVIWNTNSRRNPFHRTFFKSDEFSIDHVDVLSVEEI